MMFIFASRNARDVVFREELRLAQRARTGENLCGFDAHQHRGENGLRAGAQRDDAMILQQYDARKRTVFCHKSGDFGLNVLRQL